jgi:predicted LPLAT superfamily acyltransferase
MAGELNFTSPGTRTGHWAGVNEVSFVAGMRLLFWIYRTLGAWPFRAVLYPVLAWYMLTKPAARAASIKYLLHVSAYADGPRIAPGMKTVMRHFAAFAEAILDKLLLWGGLFPVDGTVFHGEKQMIAAIAAKRGGLLICSHLGNLELCRVLSKRRAGLKLNVLVHTKHAQAFNRMLAQLDPDSQLNLMQVSEMSPATAMLLNQKVEQGEFVVIAGDRIPVSPNPRVVSAPFLGAAAPFPIGPYVLASLLKCPAYLLFSMRTPRGPEVHFELFRESIRLPRARRDDALAELVTDYAARLEHFCRRAPLQWFNFYDFWHLPSMDNPDASC